MNLPLPLTLFSQTSEVVAFTLLSGAADVNSAAGTIVYGKLAQSPILNLLGDCLGQNNSASNLLSSVSFSNGAMIRAQEKGFVDDGNADDRLSRTAALLKVNGDWALNYKTGVLVVKKATTAANQTIASYLSNALTTTVTS